MKILNLLPSTVLSVCLLMSSCSNVERVFDDNTTTNELSSSTLMKNYSGEELFSSIFFAYGGFANNLSLYKDNSGKLDQSSYDFKNVKLFKERFNSFVTEVKKSDPSYFNKFKQQILSHDFVTVQNAIKYGSIKLYENITIIMPEAKSLISSIEKDLEGSDILNEKGEIDPKKIEQKKNNFIETAKIESVNSEACLAEVLYFAVAVHNTAAITANLAIVGAVAVYLGVKFWGPKIKSAAFEESEFSNLQADILVKDIVEAK
ncbi:hypothetical protein [Flavobacterium oreochromis]|uniref:hypothetical protein n=1 Tax=Flavobacterium oreochromis TaxID=2906078 RepID=UPI000F4ED36D|nr:hypothetical protein [Flavobacterium oreochromis]